MSEEVFSAAQRCERCGVLCQPGGPGTPQARLLRRADRGVCASCGLTRWLKATSPLSQMLARLGPAVLRSEDVQRQVAAVLAAGQADASVSEIDWEAVIANWGVS